MNLEDLYNSYISKFGLEKITSKCFTEFIYTSISQKSDKSDALFIKYRDMSTSLYNKLKTERLKAGVEKITGLKLEDNKIEELEKFFYSSKQSAKSRSGKEFEFLILMYLKELGLSCYHQKCECCKCSDDTVFGDIIVVFKDEHYLFSCKRTLKERWQEIVSEKNKYIRDTFCVTYEVPTEFVSLKLIKNNIKLLSIKNNEFTSLVKRRFSDTHKFIDLFCGAGGFSEGMEQAGFVGLFGVDNTKVCIETYNKNHYNTGLCKDIYDLTVEELLKYKNIDLVCLSPPCQAFSKAGKRNPDDPRSDCLTKSLEILKIISPKFFCLENVVGIKSFKNSQGLNLFNNFVTEMTKSGYKLSSETLNSADFSVPQNRRRIFVVGNRLGIDFSFSKKEYPKVYLKNILLETVPDKYYHSQKMINGFKHRLEKNKQSGKGFGATFNKFPFECVSRTLSCRYYKDFAECLLEYSPEKVRGLTEIEAARVQSFLDTYYFSGSSREKYIQIGNSVSVNVSKYIGERIKQYLDKYILLKENIQKEKKEKLDASELQKKTVAELRTCCKKYNFSGLSNKRKHELIELLLKANQT